MEKIRKISKEQVVMAFVATCIETTARQLNTNYNEIYQRMERVGMIENYILPNYETTVYHRSTEKVENPICRFGRKHLDFGQGFYVTNLREQAVAWANNTARNRKIPALLNRYKLERETILKNYKCKMFKAYDEEWLEFIAGNRSGLDLAKEFDYVEGGVANDRVIDTINLYMAGLIPIEIALEELSKHQPNNQMCILNQDIINKHLRYDRTEKL